MRQITTAAGIGDFLFIAQKLINQPEKFDWIFPASTPRRAFQLQEVLPQLINSVDHKEKLSYKNIALSQYNGTWGKAPNKFTLAANTHLESGVRIEEFLPDLKTSYLLPFHTTSIEKEAAEMVITGKWIGIYTSAYSMARHWNGWGKEEWMKLIRLLMNENPGYRFVIFGASYDIGISDEIAKELPEEKRIVLIDQPLSIVIEVMRRLEIMLAFPSGMPILHELCGGKKTLMFHPKHLQKLMNTWPDPERIKDGRYKGCVFCSPQQIFEWMKNNWL